MSKFKKFNPIIDGLAGVGLSFSSLCLRSLAIMLIWGWFVVPLGVPGIGIATAYGLGALASTFTYTGKSAAALKMQEALPEEEYHDLTMKSLWMADAAILLVVFFAYIAHLFI